MRLNPADKDVTSALSAIVPHALKDREDSRYQEDPRRRFNGKPGLIVVPACVEDVSNILKICHHHGVPVIPFGGGTGLVGGQLAHSELPRPVILSTERLKSVRDVNLVASLITVEAGCTLRDVQLEAEKHERHFPLLLASNGSCQIGGNLATNAGGANVVRYGNMRDLCLGIEAVFADGAIWNGLTGLSKDNRGYDLRNLLIGSEGTLAIITAACLKIFPIPCDRTVFLASVNDPHAALQLLEPTRQRFGHMMSSFELISRVGIDFLCETDPTFTKPYDPIPDWMVLVDIGSECPINLEEQVLAMLGAEQDKGVIANVLFAQSESQIQKFWNTRESIPEANRRIGALASHDISLPIETIPQFIADCGTMIAKIAAFRINCFGHLGDGNLHYNVFPPQGLQAIDFADHRDTVSETVHGLVRQLGGSTMAEHGVGRIKTTDLSAYENPAYMNALTSIKSALDPKGILNPGVIIETKRD